MGVIRGNAALLWSDSDGVETERVLLLREPLRELKPAHNQTVFTADTLDKTVRQVFTVGEGVDEMVGRIRYQDDPQGLLDLIKAGSKKRTITYVPDLDDADRRYACYLIAPNSPYQLDMDPDTGVTFGNLDVEIRLRKTDNTPFADPWKQDRLFSWRAGGRMEEATYSRADVASYAALAGGGGYGTLTTAASGAARTHWMSTASSRGPRTFPTLLLEEQRTNRVLQSRNFGSTTWTKTAVTATTGQSDPWGGTNAALVSDASTVTAGRITQNITVTATTRGVLSVIVKQGTTAHASGGRFQVLTSGGATFAGMVRMKVTWSSGVATFVSEGAGFGTLVANPERFRGGFYRAGIRSTANWSTGVKQVMIQPAGVGGSTAKGNIYLAHVQVEQ